MEMKKKRGRKPKKALSENKLLKLKSGSLYGKSVYKVPYIHGNFRESDFT